MTLDEYKQAKLDMENEIYEALQKFKNKTGLVPEGIVLKTVRDYPVGSESSQYLTKVEARVVL